MNKGTGEIGIGRSLYVTGAFIPGEHIFTILYRKVLVFLVTQRVC
jgi:hypothetical protein